jgi:hypothetical protein
MSTEQKRTITQKVIKYLPNGQTKTYTYEKLAPVKRTPGPKPKRNKKTAIQLLGDIQDDAVAGEILAFIIKKLNRGNAPANASVEHSDPAE